MGVAEAHAELLFTQLIGQCAVEIGQLPYHPEVHLLRPLAQAAQLKVVVHLLS